MTGTRDRLLDAAESGIRLKGYHAVSFRDLADELGIKSASVHYYFRQKEDLGLALVERYAAGFFEVLARAEKGAATPLDRLQAYCRVYRRALAETDKICLCGMLGAECCGLPDALSKAVGDFFQRNLDWLVQSLPAELRLGERRQKAAHILASLQGAMVLASALRDTRIFDRAVRDLLGTQDL